MDLKFIYTDKNYIELGYLKHATLDVDIGKYGLSENDFEVTVSIADRDERFDDGSLFYAENTEWGGLLSKKRVSTGEGIVVYIGRTFRGMLEKEYIQPATDETHLVLQGDANECIKTLIDSKYADLFVVEDETSGININYSVRDLNLLEALEKALGSANAKLDIRHKNDGKVHLKAVLIKDLSDELQYDNSYQVNMNVETKDVPYNHILALGKGELTKRLRINLYLQKDGTWGDAEYYTGIDRKTYLYEDVNTDDADKLKEKAIEKVKEENGSDTLDIVFSSDDAELFDVVGAKEQITDISFKQAITQKILKGTINNLSVSYKVGE